MLKKLALMFGACVAVFLAAAFVHGDIAFWHWETGARLVIVCFAVILCALVVTHAD